VPPRPIPPAAAIDPLNRQSVGVLKSSSKTSPKHSEQLGVSSPKAAAALQFPTGRAPKQVVFPRESLVLFSKALHTLESDDGSDDDVVKTYSGKGGDSHAPSTPCRSTYEADERRWKETYLPNFFPYKYKDGFS